VKPIHLIDEFHSNLHHPASVSCASSCCSCFRKSHSRQQKRLWKLEAQVSNTWKIQASVHIYMNDQNCLASGVNNGLGMVAHDIPHHYQSLRHFAGRYNSVPALLIFVGQLDTHLHVNLPLHLYYMDSRIEES
jgi:hypothetical protein